MSWMTQSTPSSTSKAVPVAESASAAVSRVRNRKLPRTPLITNPLSAPWQPDTSTDDCLNRRKGYRLDRDRVAIWVARHADVVRPDGPVIALLHPNSLTGVFDGRRAGVIEHKYGQIEDRRTGKAGQRCGGPHA